MRSRRVAAGVVATLMMITAACSSSGQGVPGAGTNAGGGSAGSLTAAPACANPGPVQLDGALPTVPNPDVKGKVTMWGWYNVAPQATLDLLKTYYPNVQVEFVDYALSDTLSKLQTALNAGSGAPDLAMVEDKSLPVVWDQGLYDLTACVQPYQQDFPSFKWARMTRPDQKLVAAPWEINPGFITYRRDVFARYGIDADAIKTWDDFVAAGQKVKQASGGTVAWTESNVSDAGNGTENLLGDLELMVNQQGGRLFDANGDIVADQPTTVRALGLLKSFRDQGLTANDFGSKQAELAALRDGKVATFIGEASSRFFLSDALKDTSGKWGIMPLPAFEAGGSRGAVNGGTSIVMPAQGKNTEAAWAFLKIWLLTTDGRYQSFQKGQLVENLFLPAAEDSRFTRPDPFYGGDKFLQFSIESAKSAAPFPSGATLPQYETNVVKQLPAYLAGKKTADQVITEAVGSIR